MPGIVRRRLPHHVAHFVLGAFIILIGWQTASTAYVRAHYEAVSPQTPAQPYALPTPVSAALTKSPAAPAAISSKSRVLGASTVASAGGGGFGIAGNMASLSPAALNARLDGIKALGVGWVRFDIEWSNIEYAGPGVYDWGTYDRVAAAVQSHGLRALAIIDYTPAWARQASCSGTAMCAPADPAAYGRFARAAAAHYVPYGMHTWEIWNEPNNLNYYQPAANPVAYTALLKAAYPAIKQVDPESSVLTAGTSPAATGGGYMSPPDFVRGLYAAGAKGYFDAVAHHPYTWPYSPAWTNPDGAWGQLTAIHAIMSANGDGNKKIWITEFGAPTGGPGGLASNGFSTVEGGDDHVTDALQAKILTDAVHLEEGLPWVGPLFWYTYQDGGTSSNTVENFFGLIRADGSHKPAYAVFQNLIRGS